jgi:uncharacterized protein involved in exopolysaccharide biosynthesis
VDAVNEQLRSHQAFDTIVKNLNLDSGLLGLPQAQRAERREALVEGLLGRTAVDVRKPSDSTLYFVYVSHQGPDADECQRVVAELSQYYQNLVYDLPMAEQQKVVEARRSQEAEARDALDRVAAQKLDFEQKNAEFLDGAEEKLGEIRRQIRQLEEVTIASLDKDVRDLTDLIAKEPKSTTVKEHKVDSQRMAVLEERIRDVGEKLTQLTVVEKKTEEHPDVIAQREVLRNLDAEKKRIFDEAPVVEQVAPNEMYVSLGNELRAKRSQRDGADRQLRYLRDQEREQAELCKKTPEIRARAKELAASLEGCRKTHEDAGGRLTKAEQEIDNLRRQGTLQIRQLDPPVRPRKPSGPGPLVLALAGLLVGLAVGVGTAALLDATDRSFREVDPVADFLGVPTMGAIHLIQTTAEVRERRRTRRRRVAALGVLAVVAGASVAIAVTCDLDALRAFLKSASG